MLPYGSIKEAEAALGRSLTFAETLWFDYSGTMSDYLLYCHNTLFAIVVFTIAPLPLVLMELPRFPGILRYKIQPRVGLSLSEMFRCYKAVVWKFFVVVGPLQLVSYPSIKVSQNPPILYSSDATGSSLFYFGVAYER